VDEKDMEIKPINIVCFYWQGSDRPGWEDLGLGMEYIEKLYRGFKRNTTIPFKFHCITTIHEEFLNPDIIFHELKSPSWLGCLPKYSMFNPEYELDGRVFACDLDVIITGNMDDILSYSGDFSTRRTFHGKPESGGDMIAFDGGTYRWIWDSFSEDTESIVDFTQGRERWLYRYHPDMEPFPFLQDLYPNQMYSYKNHINRGRGLPEDARIVSCHGKPRPHQIYEDWVKEHWRI
jgi:hypothetical protein